MKLKEFQFDLLKSIDENLKDANNFEISLPASPLQQKLATEEPTLTSREFEIMHMTLSGLSIYDISIKIRLSPHGVKYRLSSVYNKFNSKNRLELLNKAATVGLQFLTDSGIRHNFQLSVNMREHDETKNKK